MSDDNSESIVDAMIKKSGSNVRKAENFIHTIKMNTEKNTVEFTEDEAAIIYDLIQAEDKNAKLAMDDLRTKSGLDAAKVNAIVLHLIQDEKIIGFINDRETADLSDDLLILVEKRFIDEYSDDD